MILSQRGLIELRVCSLLSRHQRARPLLKSKLRLWLSVVQGDAAR